MSDNFRLLVASEGRDNLERGMAIAFSRYSGASHYAVRQPVEAIVDTEKPYLNKPAKPLRLVFMWSGSGKDAIALPFKLDVAGAVDFAVRWLAEQPYPREPDHDGDNGKGWQLYTESWGHVDDEYQAIVAVAPMWMMYGK